VFKSISRQIIRILKLPPELLAQASHDDEEIKYLFRNLLTMVPVGKQLVLILDGIDRLNATDWLPQNVERVKMVISVTNARDFVSDDTRRECRMISIEPMNKIESLSLLSSWLQKSRRKLSPEQWSVIERYYIGNDAHRPLYLKLVFDVIASMHSYDDVKNIEKGMGKLIHSLFKKLEQKHGKVLVNRAFGYLCLSRKGLSEAEMEDLLSLDDIVRKDIGIDREKKHSMHTKHAPD